MRCELGTTTPRGPVRSFYPAPLSAGQRPPPARQSKIIKQFVATLSQPATKDIGHETWEDARGRIVPVLKPRNYIGTEGPTQHLLTTEWLADVLICYVIRSKKMFRFVTRWDLNRWGTDSESLHQIAIENLTR